MNKFKKLVPFLLILAVLIAVPICLGSTKQPSGADPADIPGHYDLWTFATGSGDFLTEMDHDEIGMTGFVFLEKDHTGKMGQSVSGTESNNNDITWDDKGNISMFGNNLYTFKVVGDVLVVDMGGGAMQYFYVRGGVSGEKAYAEYKKSKGLKGTSSLASSGDTDEGGIERGDSDDVTVSTAP